MPRQNRVDPFSEIRADTYRGEWFGNRGVLHNARGEIVRHHQGTRWIYCVLEFKGRRRPLMRPGHYTELFFRDEATALAAGHRPCMECQRERAKEFLRCAGFDSVRELDAALHAERLSRPEVDWRSLPNGAMVTDGKNAFLVEAGDLLMWSSAWYSICDVPPERSWLLTPAVTVRALRMGFCCHRELESLQTSSD